MPSPKDPNKYLGPNVYTGVDVIRNRSPGLSDYRQPETGRNYELMTIWQVGKDPSAGTEGDLWILSKIIANQGYWVKIASGVTPSGGVLTLSDTANTLVFPTVGGNIQLEGTAGISITSVPLSNKLTFALTGGSGAIDSVNVQAVTAPGVDPVLPTALGLMTINGNHVVSHAIPVQTHSRALNEFDIDVQLASEQAASSQSNAGLASFNDTQFDVDAAGFVSLIGSTGPATTKFDVQAVTGPGVDPAVPTAAGVITVNGALVAAHSVPLETRSRALNAYNVEAQVASVVTPTPANTNDAGMASYNTNHFTIDATSAMVSIKSSMINGPLGDSYNLGINYASPTFKLTSSSGTALSATNLAYVVIPSNVSNGYKVVLPVSADITFEDDSGTSVLTGNLWGTTTLVAWSNAMPFYLYAVADAADANPTFMISRVPHLTITPVAGLIAKSGSAVASTEGSMFAIDSTVTVANYASMGCVRIGAFRMAKNDAANNDWTVQAMTDSDGIGRTMEDVFFTFPGDQNGAVRGGLSSSVGGDTVPTPNNSGLNYRIDASGQCRYVYSVDGYSIVGVGAGQIRFHLPMRIGYTNVNYSPSQGASHINTGAGTYSTLALRTTLTLSTYLNMLPTGAGVALLTPAYFTADLNSFGVAIDYMITNA